MRPSEGGLGKLALGPVLFGMWSSHSSLGTVNAVHSSVGVSTGVEVRQSLPLALCPVRTVSSSPFLPSSLGCLVTWPLPVVTARGVDCLWSRCPFATWLVAPSMSHPCTGCGGTAQCPQTLHAVERDSFSAVPLVLSVWPSGTFSSPLFFACPWCPGN